MSLALVGMIAGMILGDLAVGGRLAPDTGTGGSFAEFSANPKALTPDNVPAPSCLDCADSHAAAARLNARRAERMSSAFRDLGTVETGPPAPVPEPEDDYRYGGRFPDPAPMAAPRTLPLRPLPADVDARPAPVGKSPVERAARPETAQSEKLEPRAERKAPPDRLPDN